MHVTSYYSVNASRDSVFESRVQRFFIPNIVKHIRCDFSRTNEIKGNVWIHVEKLKNFFFNKVDLDKTYEKNKIIKFDKNKHIVC